ncbi:MAG TPA: 4-hydroxy-3-methylbut-2-enyl diphosphate reductase [Flavobacteriales bacterium]|jgi:4-hydroxy-3-methylbut-2-enyl diphosphate reductase|nr:4-hydroxy-3-methylbut-2-enyl diphosphate reductase [Flavobacteriales bacterium]HIB76273.1 4-hydroxy-3-methylbut-2-enyl diphosphate reductase [Flavobacteriales bacterium]HIO16558.1 4-hydroxy-3-methylbut-2-enyl diphosphate reductase [Flavobacteriales bacterium]
MRSFDIPDHFKSPIISRVKAHRKAMDARKLDFSPSVLDFGAVKIQLARHFGFCFGVENAIEISYKAIFENPGKHIFLLSQMIHNPEVNEDLLSRGVKFLMDTGGNEITPMSEVQSEDVVIIPAFGTTLETEALLKEIGVDIKKYDTTCPFVERVWKRSSKLGGDDFTVVIHGKPTHEETRATFSHASNAGPALIVSDREEAVILAEIIKGTRPRSDFDPIFKGRTSDGFDLVKDLEKIGVVNQTTMIASETQEIADILKAAASDFANTKDTLCYATNDNQKATLGALEEGGADLVVVVGGYNSSNTTHIVEICEEHKPTFFIRNELEWEENGSLNHFNIVTKKRENYPNFLRGEPSQMPEIPTILITSGASCPDASMERVLLKILEKFPESKDVESVLTIWES